MKTHTAQLMLVALWVAGLASPASLGSPPPLTEQQVEAMRQSMGREIWPYSGFNIDEMDPRDPESYIRRLTGGWRHGMPRQLLDVVAIAPAHFAPAIRDQLMRLPDTLEEYQLDLERDEPRNSITYQESMHPFDPPARRLLVVVSYLDREHAEPILREFFDKVTPLVLAAR